MSYDIDLMIDTGSEWPALVHECGNYTYNVSPMYKIAFEDERGINVLANMPANEAVPVLKRAIAVMTRSNMQCHAVRPANNWGSYGGALRYLKAILDGCEANPKTYVRIG